VIVSTLNQEECDLLVAELFAEAHGLRMKYEAFSQYTEAIIAEHELERKQMATKLEQMATKLEQLTRDLAVVNAQRAQIHADLVELTSKIDKLTAQRDNARSRVKALESARSYKVARRLRRVLPGFLRGN